LPGSNDWSGWPVVRVLSPRSECNIVLAGHSDWSLETYEAGLTEESFDARPTLGVIASIKGGCAIRPEEALTMSGTATSHDWVTNVKKHVPNADETAIHGIVKHLGIALRNKDSSFVACTDKKERDLVRDHFLKKKLELERIPVDFTHSLSA
jgi:hypothetical protein